MDQKTVWTSCFRGMMQEVLDLEFQFFSEKCVHGELWDRKGPLWWFVRGKSDVGHNPIMEKLVMTQSHGTFTVLKTLLTITRG